MSRILELVPIPDRASINRGVSPAPTRSLIEARGEPDTAHWAGRMDSRDVGLPYADGETTIRPYRVAGHRLALDALEAALAELGRIAPEVRAALGTAGMLVVRRVRGSRAWSNHSLGLAVDLTLGGVLTARGSETCPAGLLDVYRAFKGHGWYWGAGFPIRDAMHLECSAETIRSWGDRL